MSNRLSGESSPYLLQHAHNPVDWYPWGEEALSRARDEDLPILLSIGYSACHWCHVMERESFEDEETARLMNEGFVNVKVDREERPDLDAVYMQAVQSMTGHGGWPLTAFLTPEGVPYYGGTYFPPEARHGMPSFRQVLTSARDAYRNRREDIRAAAGQMRAALERAMAARPGDGSGEAPAAPGRSLLETAFRRHAGRFDPEHGGLAGAPKFPQPVNLDFVLRWHARSGSPDALHVVTHTLVRMARGGIRDQLGGGFHRYSVDARWLVPHFEKMLYDNALLARLYLHAWLVTGDPELRTVAESTLDYLLSDLSDPTGGFYSARDADSEGEEGLFYVWTPPEVEAVLGPEEARRFCRAYDVSPEGNFEGRSIPHLRRSLEHQAEADGVPAEELASALEEARRKLMDVRSRREHPFRDEKVIVSWNGLSVRALAEAARPLERPDFLVAAREAADFILSELREGGRLLHVWKDGEARIPAFLDDCGALANALLTLHEVTLEPGWLRKAHDLAEEILDRFWEEGDGAFYDTPRDGEALVVRPRSVMDNPTPSGTSLATELLLRLGYLLDEERFLTVADRVLEREAPALERFPTAFGGLLSAADFRVGGPVEVAMVGDPGDEATQAFLDVVHRRYLPARVVTGWDPERGEPPPQTPLLAGRTAQDGRPTAYVCEGYACQRPVTDPSGLAEQLERAPSGGAGG